MIATRPSAVDAVSSGSWGPLKWVSGLLSGLVGVAADLSSVYTRSLQGVSQETATLVVISALGAIPVIWSLRRVLAFMRS